MQGFTAGRGAPGTARGLLSKLFDGSGGKLGILTLVLIALTGAAAFWWFNRNEQYLDLYPTPMTSADLREVDQILTQSQLRHQVNLNKDGILIAPKLRAKAQMLLAERGLPRQPCRLYSAQPPLQISDALRQFEGVEDACIKIFTPPEQFFKDDAVPVKATVMLRLSPGHQLEESELAAMAHLVAQEVPELETKNVRIVDTQMTVLTATVEPAPPSSPKAAELAGRAQKQLDDVFGPHKTKVAVNIEHLPAGQIKRLTCQMSVANLKDDQIAKIGTLLHTAIGLNPERGDSLTINSLPFKEAPLEPAEGNALLAELNTPRRTSKKAGAGLLGIALCATSLAALGILGIFLMKQHRVQVQA